MRGTNSDRHEFRLARTQTGTNSDRHEFSLARTPTGTISDRHELGQVRIQFGFCIQILVSVCMIFIFHNFVTDVETNVVGTAKTSEACYKLVVLHAGLLQVCEFTILVNCLWYGIPDLLQQACYIQSHLAKQLVRTLSVVKLLRVCYNKLNCYTSKKTLHDM